MSNEKERNEALNAALKAVHELSAISALPQAVGHRIRWLGNGVIWARKGDNLWAPIDRPYWTYSSAHVASASWEAVDEDL